MTKIFESRIYKDEKKISHNKPLDVGANVSFSATLSSLNEETKKINLDKDSLLSTFKTNYEIWNDETNYLSVNNFDNPNFQKIVDMGEDAVPEIYEIIKTSPDPIVYALDKIYPNYVKTEGYVSLKDVCSAWISILQVLGKV